jgi:uncharacterized membrane protein (DUF106 family)
MKNSVIAIQPFVITTIIVYALLVPVFFEMDNAFGEENFVDNEKMTSYSQQVEVMETECKSPCPSSAEMCIAMCV